MTPQTPEQRAANLEHANQIRTNRAWLRHRIKTGAVTAASVLEEWPESMHGCGVYVFLTYLPNVGKSRSETSRAFVLLRKANLANVGHKRLDSLTGWQLERLAKVVSEYEQSKHPAERGIA